MSDIRTYADQVWNGELDDHIAGSARGEAVVDIADGLGLLPGFGNAIAFRSADELLLFDTGNPLSAKRTHAILREWSADPLTLAFYSHGHIDHVGGLDPFDAEPRPPQVIAQERVRDRFDRYALTAGYNALINRRQFGIADLRWPRSYRLPDVTFRDALTLTRAGLTFELFHAEGETDDAAVAYVPEHRLLLPGDLFVWVSPNCGNPQKAQRYPREWAQALRRMAGLGAEIMLPSHGAPVFGADRIEQALTETAEWLESLVEQTLGMMNDGHPLDEIVQRVSPPPHLADRVYLRARYDEPEFVVRNLWRRYGGWYDGNPAHLKPAPDAVLAAAVAELAGGARVLADAALRARDTGDLRLAGHLAEMATRAEPGTPALHRVRSEIYQARAEAEESLMARGIFGETARSSRELAGEETA
ncbi:alkyl sulfatase dimerization domain-containing protein [Saccharopolyspora sp. TS4A08]|uniref:Alkyl sulfatase dimerization domain-containing protein n=1 Tax=Saccharopolyspora ipomoeae TaxID=3042027 RepID=A0ABT6PMP1_9PSEU|nr:alkyl sulfatase dimerization domain-containing protein [Saccharopolyspora sp. TS4A08]MDI2029279.1 alkyl sulfatase dimerization domain-containing protein [Saccharopolyspora sp. TS4A08]